MVSFHSIEDEQQQQQHQHQQQQQEQQQQEQHQNQQQPQHDFRGLEGLFFDNQTPLASWCELEQWPQALMRLGLFPHEASLLDSDGSLALHLACRNGAPAVVLQALSGSYPGALSVCEHQDGMTPLHIACGCHDVTLDKVRALLYYSPTVGQTDSDECASHVQDRDGDTPLHAACRSTAPLDVIEQLIDVHPGALHLRDKEGLTPMLRLWVRAFVLYSEEELNAIQSKEDMTMMATGGEELQELWNKTHTCLVGLSYGRSTLPDSIPFLTIHQIVSYDCPRVVLRMALKLYPDTILESDMFGGSLLGIAINRRMFQARDLSEEGYCYLEPAVAASASAPNNPHETADDLNILFKRDGTRVLVPSVIDTLLESEPLLVEACERDGVSPLHAALRSGKGWTDGVGAIAKLRPESVCQKDGSGSGFYPFMLPAFCCSRNFTSLNTIFELLRRSPHLVMQQQADSSDDVVETSVKAAGKRKTSRVRTGHQTDPSTKKRHKTKDQPNDEPDVYLTKPWIMDSDSDDGSDDEMGHVNPWFVEEDDL
jgi:hypothetical protein